MTVESSQAEAIRARLTRDLWRGATVFRSRGGANGADRDIVYCVVTWLEGGG